MHLYCTHRHHGLRFGKRSDKMLPWKIVELNVFCTHVNIYFAFHSSRLIDNERDPTPVTSHIVDDKQPHRLRCRCWGICPRGQSRNVYYAGGKCSVSDGESKSRLEKKNNPNGAILYSNKKIIV